MITENIVRGVTCVNEDGTSTTTLASNGRLELAPALVVKVTGVN